MRRPERIPIVEEYFKQKNILTNFVNQQDKYIENILDNWEDIIEHWKNYPDLRFGQLLINKSYVEDTQELWNVEESDWLINNKYLKIEDIYFWGKNFDREGNKLPETQYILLKDLTTEHIINIKKFFNDKWKYINPRYRGYFIKRIKEEEELDQ